MAFTKDRIGEFEGHVDEAGPVVNWSIWRDGQPDQTRVCHGYYAHHEPDMNLHYALADMRRNLKYHAARQNKTAEKPDSERLCVRFEGAVHKEGAIRAATKLGLDWSVSSKMPLTVTFFGSHTRLRVLRSDLSAGGSLYI